MSLGIRPTVRYLSERRKLVVMCIIVYAIAFHFVYSRYWKNGEGGTASSVFFGVAVDSKQSSTLDLSQRHSEQSQDKPAEADSSNGGFLLSLWNRLPSLNLGNSEDTETMSSLDVHLEDSRYGHTGEVIGGSDHHHSSLSARSEIVVAVGGGITSRGVPDVTESSNFVAKFQFFHTFLPTFCQTASTNYTYRFYLAYDYNDAVFSNMKIAAAFHKTFLSEVKKLCLDPRGVKASLHLVQCSHAGSPTWAQNDAMLEAYLDDVDYFYRVNDDSRLVSGDWTNAFVRTLNGYDPPRVGVVGPNHSGGNTAILTYDFTHKTHVDLFGWYYPRLFTDWWGDDWVTMIYQPGRSTKLMDIRLDHTLGLGQRYNTHYEVGGKLQGQLNHDRPIVNRYIEAVRKHNESGFLSRSSDGRRVISMSLFGKIPRYTWGVIRNAQLVPVHFPGWRLRVYIPSADYDSVPEFAVPQRFINKLRILGVDIARVGGKVGNTTASGFSPRDWRLLVTSDRNVDYFLIRDAESRLNDRDAAAVHEWITEVERRAGTGDRNVFPIHIIRDHPKHANRAIVDGLWGGRPSALQHHLGTRLLTSLYRKLSSQSSSVAGSAAENDAIRNNQSTKPNTMLEEILKPIIIGDGASAFFHDVVSPCDRWTYGVSSKGSTSTRRAFPVPRQGQMYIGQKFDEHQEIASGDDSAQLKSDVVCSDSKTLPDNSTPSFTVGVAASVTQPS